MFTVSIKDGLQGLQSDLKNRLNRAGIRRLAAEVNRKTTQGSVGAARRQLVRDLPGYRRWANQIVGRRQGANQFRVSISRAGGINASRNATLIGYYITGGQVRFPNRLVKQYLVRIDRRFSPETIWQLMQHARAGVLESASYTSSQYKVYVNREINGKHYVVLQTDEGVYLIERYGRYRTVFAPSIAETGRSKPTRGQRNSRLIAMYPRTKRFKPTFRMEMAINRYARQQSNRIISQTTAELMANRRYQLRSR